ncbi:alpha/beta fold hydrolase [Canibacter sp. lx-72]|uniref:alpha/beta fold hydrolase n=1 Tax=Canibacter zhuwentaonis TaxID=2837491 RepID=UPI001BDCA495|nr:alpha/beta fold hydrolase [Canibacter zhuwentaonis]MBT1018394.1 alpha/beta fold hydrolase [Canibacter zhuwentaonis]MBT1018739.1 alpha/beta fold hydrolase [Canibacter zhuwentaonis]
MQKSPYGKRAKCLGAVAFLSLTLSALNPAAAFAESGVATEEENKQQLEQQVSAGGDVVYAPGAEGFVAAARELLQKDTVQQQVPSEEEEQDAPVTEQNPAEFTEAQAEVPNPLDFASQKPDPDSFLIPQAAERYKTTAGDYKIGQPLSGGKANGAVVSGLESYYDQLVNWGSCKGFSPTNDSSFDNAALQCGYLIVPVNYSNPTGPTAAIALLKVPAKKPDEKIGTVFVDPGGPGGSGVSTAVAMFDATGELRDRFDIVGFDPRGVAASLPMIRCKSSAAFDAQRGGSDELKAADLDKILKHNTEECYKNTGKGFNVSGETFINNVGTTNVVKDLDIARSAVGDKKLSYLGYSYGTSIGYHYAKQFPDNIRALVLDGVVNPLQNNPELEKKYSEYTKNVVGDQNLSSELTQIQGFQATFEQFLKACVKGFNNRPCALGTSTDTKVLFAEYQKIVQKAWGAKTYQTKEAKPRAVSFNDTITGVILAMYGEHLWSYLNIALQQLKESNDGSTIMLLADTYYSRNPSTGLYGYDDSAFQTIWCNDNGQDIKHDDAKVIAEAKKRYELAPFTDPGRDASGKQRGLEPAADWCTYYKVKDTLPQGEELKAMPNILYISTTYDSATPYQDGIVAAAVTGATVLSAVGNSHTSYYPGTGDCVEEITNRYFVDLIAPTDITGATDVDTKDIYSRVVKGNQCRVDSFRAVPKLTVKEVQPVGGVAEVLATGLVRNTAYTLALPEGYVAAEEGGNTVVADVNGVAIFRVKLAEGSKRGAAEFKVAPAEGEITDPLVTATATLELFTDAPVVAPDVTVPVSSEKKDDVAKTTKDKKLVNTGGGDIALPLLIAGGLLVVGAGSVLVARRRSAKA